MASPAKVTEKEVEFYGTTVPQSVKVASDPLIGSAIVAATEYTVESGPNKGKTENYTVEIGKKALTELLGEDTDKASDFGEFDDKGNLQVPFTNLEATNLEGALALCGGSEKKFLTMFNRSYNMSRRQDVRVSVLSKLEGPQKAINKAVEAFVAMGIPREIAEAKVAELQALVTE